MMYTQTLRKFNWENPLIHSLLVFLSFSLLFTLFFAPVLFSGRLLAPGDGIVYYLPALYSAKTLWTNLIFGGYPVVGDPQNMTWYPPALLLHWIPNSWNALVVLAYVLAGSFAYCYGYILTRSRLAASVSGVVYSMCGFMMAHLGHTTIIHAAAWMPLLLCAMERLRHGFSRLWFGLGILAVGCCVLGGHPQIALYSLGIGFFYALFLGWRVPLGRGKYYAYAIGVLAVGLALCSIQIIPTAELSRLSLRSEMTFEAFSSFSLPRWQTLQTLFPYFFGGGLLPPFNFPYWGKYSLTELTGYLGWLPLMLAMVGAISHPRRSIVRFWLWVGVIAFLLTFGGDTFLGHLLYNVPVYNKFRAQGRHAIEVALAVSVLAGFGVAAIQRRLVARKVIFGTIATTIAVLLLSLVSMGILHPAFQEKAIRAGVTAPLDFWPWSNPAVGVPIMMCVASLVGFGLLLRWRDRRWVGLILIPILIADLSTFGWFWEWQVNSPLATEIEAKPIAQKYRSLLASNHQRFFSQAETALFPNLTRLWDLPNASGYSPLILSRYSELMRMSPNGVLLSPPVKMEERQLDLMAVRYLLDPDSGMTEVPGVAWGGQNLGLILGENPCGPVSPQPSIDLSLPELAQSVSEIGFVTSLGCAVTIPEGKSVLQVKVTDVDGNVESHSLVAGRDTSENAYDCPQVKPEMKHGRAPIFESVAVTGCDVHIYVSKVALTRSQRVKKLELAWRDRGLGGVISIRHISLQNRAQNISVPVTAISVSPKWKKVEQTEVGTIYENQDVMPRAWLVSQTLQLSPPEILAAIQTSNLPGGRKYDPKEIALVENKRARFQSSALQPGHRATVLKMADTQIEVQTQTAVPAFLVLSDVYYPGWQATIDGKPTRIFRTNYIQRGVKVPAGDHVVRFEFHPSSFKIGVGITTATLVVGGYGLWRLGRKQSSLKEMDAGMPF
ncbi:YfhO family protein [Thermoleptolyngbya sp.]